MAFIINIIMATRYFLYVLLVYTLLSCTQEAPVNKMVFIGEVYESEPMVNVTFMFPGKARIKGDTLFVIVTNDSLLTCRTKDGVELYMRRLYSQTYDY